MKAIQSIMNEDGSFLHGNIEEAIRKGGEYELYKLPEGCDQWEKVDTPVKFSPFDEYKIVTQ